MKSSPDHLLVFSTCPDHDTARMLANTLVDEALAGCINILPGLTSVYHWQGERKTGTEELLMIKTTRNSYPALEARIVELHPYELPEIIAVSMEAGLAGYLSWIDQSCQRSME